MNYKEAWNKLRFIVSELAESELEDSKHCTQDFIKSGLHEHAAGVLMNTIRVMNELENPTKA